MTKLVSIPLWLLILVLLFAAVTFASHFLFPSVRWFFRRRAERLVAQMNKRLTRPIEPFKLAKRFDMVQRLVYDPAVSAAIHDHAQRHGIPENVAFEQARAYAREIVPGFSATAYYSVGMRFARWMSRSLYRVKVDELDKNRLDEISGDAAVIFVINHRSNMDYVLITWLVSNATALSYAVGEWARVWPLAPIIRSMGAYFIRRKDRSQLYRRVLARYVQLAMEGGATQAIFPEGGLSLDGAPCPPKLGLLNYIVTGYVPGGGDVVFIPVGMNYDQVLEDRYLINADQAGNRRFRPQYGPATMSFLAHIRDRVLRRFKRFGTFSASFAAPLSLDEFIKNRGGGVDDKLTEDLALELMARMGAVIPIMPVPLVAKILLKGQGLDEATITAEAAALLALFEGGTVPIPDSNAAEICADALDQLSRRKLIKKQGQLWLVVAEEVPVLRFYANSIAHHFVDLLPIADQSDE
ncbi:MAG: 1-acyl-sn-glycerol-3-phosphate acyltransferase [Rhodobacteraceae bacterium]|nr:1-acyl-sn-glycerol-3-phosphate acyltransferase [Paracoccaceae bacterium]